MSAALALGVHRASKAGFCINAGAHEVGNAPMCTTRIEVGDLYVDGDVNPYKAGGFGKDRVCMPCSDNGDA